jgi:DNA-binding HxlR family transcriptional regulator
VQKDLLDSIPTEIRTALKVFSDDTRFAIVLTLLKDGNMSFSELADSLGIEKNILSHHLKTLVQSAFVKNYYDKKDNTSDYSFYASTTLSRDIIDRLFGIMEPTKSSADALADIYMACKMYEKGSLKLFEAIQTYAPASSLDSITLIRNEAMSIGKLLPITPKRLQVEARR